MSNDFQPQETHLPSSSLKDILNSLEEVKGQLLSEITSKQASISKLEVKLSELEKTVSERNVTVEELNQKLELSHRQTEGNKQLVNKLLNDLERLQQDVEWYKRTYERRGGLGMFKQWILKRHFKI